MIRHMVAMDGHRGIAKNGSIPWNIPRDTRYYHELTKNDGGIVLMGRTTFDAIGRPLEGRRNFVASRDKFEAPGATTVHDIEAFLDKHPAVWVIGGAHIYRTTLARADELYITEVEGDFGCDTFYPEFSRLFTLASRGALQRQNGHRFRFNVYRPK